jgi:hypothetical protein
MTDEVPTTIAARLAASLKSCFCWTLITLFALFALGILVEFGARWLGVPPQEIEWLRIPPQGIGPAAGQHGPAVAWLAWLACHILLGFIVMCILFALGAWIANDPSLVACRQELELVKVRAELATIRAAGDPRQGAADE